MADNNASIFNNGNENTNNTNNDQSSSSNQFNNSELEYLKHIQRTLDSILELEKSQSQFESKSQFQSRSDFRNNRSQNSSYKQSASRSRFRSGSVLDEFLDSFESQISKEIFGDDFKDKIHESMNKFADSLGVSLEDVPKTLGEELGKQASTIFKNSDIGKSFTAKFDKWKKDTLDSLEKTYKSGVDSYWKTHTGKDEADKAAQDAYRKRTEQASYQASSRTSRTYRSDDRNDSIDSQYRSSKLDLNSVRSLQVYADVVNLSADSISQSSQFDSNSYDSDSYDDDSLDTLLNLSEDSQSNARNSLDNSDTKDSSNPMLDSLGDVAGDALGDAAGKAAGDALGEKAAGSAAGAALEGLESIAGSAIPMLGTVVAGLTALDVASDVIVKTLQWTVAPALEGFAELTESVAKSFQRSNESEERNVKLANERFQADVEEMIKEPFQILEDAAQAVYDAWDANVRLINGTQGYTKDDLQSLLAAYSQRLRDDGLSSVVSSVDITQSLAQVLQSGLSGEAAEEFAYQATILNAAIPSQDFFGYASTYASIAANAIQQGMDEASALEYANEQLQLFASNVLYSSRQLSGGFTTGLQDAQTLFEQSAKIAQASGTNNAAEISSVMTAVASVVGSVAPDLASSITDIIYQAATGGNSSNLVALRSLAGINASNTEFLKQLANDPQGVFVDLFNSLGQMQKMSEDNFMEVAEGLSNIFGISMDAFTRIDFNKLADSIANMNTNTASLQENLKLLASGETTTSAEQLKMQQINEYLIDEGLAYVMDNEVARAIQQHMWDEQLARELMEAQYAVELKGSALTFLEGIRHTVDNIMTILNPFNLVDKLTDVVQTADDAKELTADVKTLLETGKVGTGNAKDLYNLTTTNKDLNLTKDIITLMGGTSAYNSPDSFLDSVSSIVGALGFSRSSTSKVSDSIDQAIVSSIDTAMKSYKSTEPNSVYSWNMQVGKSISSYLASSTPSGSSVGAYAGNVSQSSTDAAKAATKGKIDRMLDEDYMNKFIEDHKTYSDWAATAKNFGIADLSKALQDVGYSEEEVKARFQSGQANYAAEKQSERNSREETFWDNVEAYLVELNEHAIEMIDLQTYANEMLDTIYAKETQFYDAWVDYFVKHTAYSKSYDHTSVAKVQSAEKGKSQDAVYALAEALTKNSVDLLDPTIQTNALLSQILIVVNAIMQQNNESSSGTSLPDTLSALAMGLVKST